MTERSQFIEIVDDGAINAFAFSTNGEYFFTSCHNVGVRVWRMHDMTRVASMAADFVQCLAVSNDGRFIAAGAYWGVFIWDANTYKQVCTLQDDYVTAIEFSPNSTQLVTGSGNRRVTLWEVATWQPVVDPLLHDYSVKAATFSQQEPHRIATATEKSVRVYDSDDGCLLVEITTPVTDLAWSCNHLFILSDGQIKRFDASTGSLVSQWAVPDTNDDSCISLARHGAFIAYSSDCTVTFWETLTHAQVGLTQHSQDIRSTVFSPDDRFLAIGGKGGKVGERDGKIAIRRLSDLVTLPRLHTFQEPVIQIDDDTLHCWKHGQLADVEASLTASFTNSRRSRPYALASRALVRTRSRQLDAAIDDANQSIDIQPSVIGYIAKSVALVSKGEKLKGYRTCDIAIAHSRLAHINFLLLVKAVIVFMSGEHDDAISRLDDLIAATPKFNSICYVVQACMYLLHGNMRMENDDYEGAIQLFERARARVQPHESRPLLIISLISGWKFDDLGITIRQRLCEALYAIGRMEEGSECLVEMVDALDKEVYASESVTKWVSGFTCRCLSEATVDYETLESLIPVQLLKEWARSTLATSSWRDALAASINFAVPRFTIYRAVCEYLKASRRVTDACECFRQVMVEFVGQTSVHDEQGAWVLDFKRRCSAKIEGLGDIALNTKRYEDAISLYSTLLSLDPVAPQGILIKRSKAYLARGSSEDALDDANKVTTIDPSSPWGYERKHAALHKARDYENAINAFETMLSKMSMSPDLGVREHHQRYIHPSETRVAIRKAVQDAIRGSPPVLMNTNSGRLCDKSEQAAAFESSSLFSELISSMTTKIDHARIKQEVTECYRYVTFSHKWEDNEPLFEKVVHVAVYGLEKSPTHEKLQMFCKIVRDAGFRWAWSDTCCINKADHHVLQEALVLMFKWYEGSALTIVLLRDVRSPSRRGDLVGSIWNSRAWTLQEYHASKVVRFYNEDWTLYLNLDIPNHKESPEVISEMEKATGVSARALMALRPGLDDIRDKLRLASGRQTTRVEDAAYSLFGIFSVSLPVVYGEGDKALGKLLAQLLTSSGDTSILAWTGRSGSFNSCLPADVAAFSQLPASHVPPALEEPEIEAIISRLRTPSLDLGLVMKLYDRLNELPVPSFAGTRMKLPCLLFKLGTLSTSRTNSGYVFRAQTIGLGKVEISTKENLSRLESLYLVHPWLDFLLHRQPVGNVAGIIPETNADDQLCSISEMPLLEDTASTVLVAPPIRATRFIHRLARPFGGRPTTTTGGAGSLRPPSSLLQTEKQTHALQLVARLRQPFGALLFTPTRQNVPEYRRVAAESVITVRVEEVTSTVLNKLVQGVCVLDVL